MSHAQNTTALQLNLFLTRINRLLAKKRRSVFSNVNHCQGQLQTPQSVTVGDIVCTEFNTNSMEQRLFRQANYPSEHKDIPHVLKSRFVHYLPHNSRLLTPTLSQQSYNLQLYFFKTILY